jgi:hypothetical protein
MEVILTVSPSKHLHDVSVRAHTNFRRLREEFPRAACITWHTLARGASCVYRALPSFGSVGSMLDGLWSVAHAYDA